MVTNREIKSKLCKKLKISESALYASAKRRYPALYQVGVDEAIYVFALDLGIGIKRLLPKDVVERIRLLHGQYGSGNGSDAKVESKNLRGAGPGRYGNPSVIKFGSGEQFDDPLVPDTIKREARDMAQLYPYLYYLENSIRSFLVKAMEKYHGPGWWNTHIKPSLQEKVKERQKTDIKNEWHQKRGDREIDYLDFVELTQVYSKVKANLVRDGILPNEGWLEHLINEIYPSRCVVAHMNPLNSDNTQLVKLRVKQWNRQVKGKIIELGA